MSVTTLDAVLRQRAEDAADRGFTFLDGAHAQTRRTYADLDRHASAIGSELAANLAPGSRAILLFPPGLDFVDAFFGALRAGVIAVPLAPPTDLALDAWLANVDHVARECGPDVVLTSSAFLAMKEELGIEIANGGLRWLATDELGVHGDERWPGARHGSDDTAFIQYTSGSTSNPKGVMLSHANLLANQRAIHHGFGTDPQTVMVSWLPLFHDMGLIGCVLHPMFVGYDCYLMSPLDFLRRPLRWLEVISECGGTCGGGPNFAYELCVRRSTEEERARLNLSAWRIAFNGSETVRAATLRNFAEAFAPAGFERRAFLACYGLAEASLLVTGARFPDAPHHALMSVGEPAASDARAEQVGAAATVEIVSVGIPSPEHHVAVVDPVTGRRVAGGEIGEIWVSGPSVSRGYWGRPDESAEIFGAELDDRRWLRTGDLGFVIRGELHVTGRIKDVIVVRGRNVFPTDVEDTVQATDPRLRAGCGAAFAVETPDGDGIAIVQETAEPDAAAMDELIAAIRRAVVERVGAAPAAVALVPPKTLPKTSSGKLQRARIRRAYVEGTLPELMSWRATASDLHQVEVS
jgi:acyl-CoA synthetase (AMP-forming)/AMP-acid ligase II